MACICSTMLGSLGEAGMKKTNDLCYLKLDMGKTGQWKSYGGGAVGFPVEHH